MKHFLTTGNISETNIDAVLKKNFPEGIDFCYTDPPWGNGNLKYWNTMLGKNTSQTTDQLDQENLEDRVVNLISEHVNNYAFIVYGIREAKSIMSKLREKSNVSIMKKLIIPEQKSTLIV